MAKIIAIALALMVGVISGVPVIATAGIDCPPVAGSDIDRDRLCPPVDGSGESTIKEKVRNVIRTVYSAIGIIAVVVIVISGIKYMTSQGNAEAVKKAKNAIMYALIGLIVVLAAFAITEFIISAINGG